MNAERVERGDAPFANPRNCAAGSLKMQETTEVAKRPLDCYLYTVLGDDRRFTHHYESLKDAQDWGLKISEHMKKCNSLQQVKDFIHYWDEERSKLSFDIDGVVIKVKQHCTPAGAGLYSQVATLGHCL